MANFIVTNTNDSGPGSLRQAILDANLAAGADTISFDQSLAGATITLAGTELLITESLTINGVLDTNGAPNITVEGDGDAFNIFRINDGNTASSSTVAIANLAITKGDIGVFNNESLTLSNTTISSHASEGILNSGSLTVANSEISSNFSVGLRHVNTTSLLVQNSTITNNASNGIFANNGTVAITDTTIANNDDSGLFTVNNTTTITNSTIANNTANGRGAGIFNVSDLTITNSTITGNSSAQEGGGIATYTSMTIANSTIANNVATDGYGGGIANLGSSSLLTLQSTIVADNTTTAGDNDLDNPMGGTTNAINSLIETTADQINGTNTNNITGVDPLFDPNGLADNGGPTQTIALQIESPAIDAGSNPNNLTTDQRGNDRVSGTAPDIGAYEFELPTELVVTTTDDEVNGISDGNISLREALGAIADGGTITFSNSLLNGTIALTEGELAIDRSVTINGLGADQLTLDAAQQSRIFNINDGDDTVDAVVSISGLTLTGGSATGTGTIGAGGGIYNREDLTLSNSTVSANSAATFGGGIFNIAAPLNLSNSNLSGNSAGVNGGGFHNTENATATVVNSTVSGNSAASFGGGISNVLAANLTLTNSTVTNNSAAQGGGVINSTATLTLSSSLIVGNQADTAAELSRFSGSVTSNGNNLFGYDGLTYAEAFRSLNPGTSDIIATSTLSDGSVNDDAIALTDILDTTLQDNGGPTQTHALVKGSPAINAGSNPNNLEFDQRGSGFERMISSSVDIGAFESSFSIDPEITSDAIVNVAENQISAIDVNATDADGDTEGNGLTYAVTGGDDANRFNIDAATGGVTFKTAPDFENPDDTGGNNQYSLQVTVTDSTGNNDVQDITITVTNETEAASTFVVTTLADEDFGGGTLADELADGDGLSLREAIALAGANDAGTVDTIVFAGDTIAANGDTLRDVDGNIVAVGDAGTITLTNGELVVDSSLTIDGDRNNGDAPGITIDANQQSRVFNINNVDTVETVEIAGLTITGGNNVDSGGGIFTQENLTLTNSTISGNSAASRGGGILSQRSLTTVSISNSTIAGNSAGFFGGGIAANSSLVFVANSTIANNVAGSEGGGIYGDESTVNLNNSLITGNSAGTGDEIAAIVTYVYADSNNLFGHSGQSNADAFLYFVPGDNDINATIDGTAPTALGDMLEVDANGQPLLQNNDGLTETIALVAGSPAIDGGNNANIPDDIGDQDGDGITNEATPFDQRGTGFNRVLGSSVDIGAFEFDDNTLPVAQDDGNIPAYTQQTGTNNPFNGIDVGIFSAPSLADVDGDGDLDVVVGEYDGDLSYFENTGTATAPTYTERTGTANPFNDFNLGFFSTPTFADADGDGNLDAFVGRDKGRIDYYENTGSTTAPDYTLQFDSENPFDGIDVGGYSAPTFADVDGDGDLDTVSGEFYGTLSYYQNTGSATVPTYTEQTGTDNPFNNIDIDSYLSNPTFADVDGDGDLDLLVGEGSGTLSYYQNTGSATVPTYTEQTGTNNPFNNIDVGDYSTPTFADVDGDGDLDVVVGEEDGLLNYFENLGPFFTDEDTAFTTGNVLDNDSDPDGDTLIVTNIDTTGTTGTVTNNGDGTFDYDPNDQFEDLAEGETATDTFSYTVSDGNGGNDSATVTITIKGVSDSDSPPLVQGQPATIYVDDTDTVIGNAFQAGEQPYQGNLYSNTDAEFGTGASPDDVILGTSGADDIWGGSEGNDLIDAAGGNDVVGISLGDVTVDAGPGDDFVYALGAGGGTNTIDLDSGTDNFWAQAGNNTITGTDDNTLGLGIGNDTVITTGEGIDFVYSVNGGGGTNVLNLGDGNNIIWVQQGDYTITTGTGNDEINLGNGTDTVDAGDGDNIIFMADPSGTTDGDKDILTGSGEDFVQTGSGDDLIDAGAGLNTIFGANGVDTVTIRSGAYNFLGDFTLGTDLIALDGLTLGELSFFAGSGDTAGDAFIFVGSEAIAQVADVTVAELENSANFV